MENWTGYTGWIGETIVTELLPHAKHMNEYWESTEPYDVLWNKIKIDVKTCKRSYGNSGSWTSFKAIDPTSDIIYVYLLIHEQLGNLYWVSHSSDRFLSYAHRKTAISSEDLQKAILDCHKKYSPIYKKTVDNQLSML